MSAFHQNFPSTKSALTLFFFYPLLLLLSFLVFHILINVFLSVLSFHDLSLKLRHESASCESECINFLCAPSTEFTHINEFPLYLCLHLSFIATHMQLFRIPHTHADICHTQSFIFLMLHNTKQFRHSIRFLSTCLQFVITRIRAHTGI